MLHDPEGSRYRNLEGDVMKTTVKRALRDEKGAAFVLTLVLLLVGGLVIPPLLGFMFGGLIQGEVYERRGAELYAADAGVEDALWKIQNQVDEVKGLTQCNPSTNHTIADVNDKSVNVSIRYIDGQTYGINSTAIGNGSGTRIEAYAVSVYGNYTGITDNVLTSQGIIDYPPKPIVDYPEGHEPQEYYEGPWPKLDTLAAWYWKDIKDATPYESGTIDLEGEDLSLGPLLREGALIIENSIEGSPTPTLTLTGTLYITGDTAIEPTQELIIDLNGHAIFVESDSRKPPKHALYIKGPKVTMIGPGVIAAIGDIYFQPNMKAGVTDPIFIISVEGMTELKPVGDFYGAVAGSVEVDLGPGSSVTYPEDGFPGDLNWPGFDRGKSKYAVDSWQVSTL